MTMDFPNNPPANSSFTSGGTTWTWDGAKWVAGGVGTGGGGATITVSDTAPANPTSGAMWFDSVGVQTYLWYPDPNSSEWVPLNAPPSATASYLPLSGGTLTGDLRVNTRAAIGTTAIPADTLAGTLFHTAIAQPTDGIYLNSYPASGNVWKYLAAGFGGWAGLNPSNGEYLIQVCPSGAAGATVGAFQNFHFGNGGNLGVGYPVPALQAPAAAANGGGWLFGWGITCDNMISRAYYNGTNWCYLDGVNIPSLFQCGNGGFTWAGALAVGTAGATFNVTTRMTLDHNGNLGLGVVPPAGATDPGWAFSRQGVIAPNFANNMYFDGTNWHLTSANAASYFYVGLGNFSWQSVPSGAAGSVVTAPSIMVLDPNGTLHVANGGVVDDPLQVTVANGHYARTYYMVTGTRSWTCGASSNGTFTIADENYPATRVQIDTAGNGHFTGSGTSRWGFEGCWGVAFNGCPYGTGNGFAFGWGSVSAGLVAVSVDGGGAAYSIANASDARLKTDIAPHAYDCLATVNAIPVHEFHWLDVGIDPWKLREARAQNRRAEEKPKVRAGLVAQEIQAMFPEGVIEGNNFEDRLGKVWSLENTALFGLLIGAIQQLTARVAALEGV
jgi:hypothetical protein